MHTLFYLILAVLSHGYLLLTGLMEGRDSLSLSRLQKPHTASEEEPQADYSGLLHYWQHGSFLNTVQKESNIRLASPAWRGLSSGFSDFPDSLMNAATSSLA